MVSGALIGDRELVARLGRLPEQTRRDVRDTVIALGFELQRICLLYTSPSPRDRG